MKLIDICLYLMFNLLISCIFPKKKYLYFDIDRNIKKKSFNALRNILKTIRYFIYIYLKKMKKKSLISITKSKRSI